MSDETVTKAIYDQVLGAMKRGVTPSFLVIGRRRYRALQFELYGHHDTAIPNINMAGFLLRVVVEVDYDILTVAGTHVMPEPAAIPEPPFFFVLAPDARLEQPLRYDLTPGVLYVATAQKMDMAQGKYWIKPEGKGCWLESGDIVGMPHLSVN